jgi:hypothetical protein
MDVASAVRVAASYLRREIYELGDCRGRRRGCGLV